MRKAIVYRLNSQDEFIDLNDEWSHFAVANNTSSLLPDHVLGRPLWDFITDQTTSQLYREMLDQVHAGRSVKFNFRCDGPEHRRYMEMTISPLDGGQVQFESRTVREEERPRQELLDPLAPRAGDLLRICGWCKRVDVGKGKWGEVEEAVATFRLFERQALPMMTHGMCEGCFKTISAEIAERRVAPNFNSPR
jgi:hypothetical protein